jgi:hypothetical protein
MGQTRELPLEYEYQKGVLRFARQDLLGGGLFDTLGTKPDSTLWKGTSMRRLLFIVLSVCFLSTGVLAQTSGSPGGLVVFETYGFGVGTAATQAGVLPGVMTTQTVLFATSDARLSRNLGLAIVNPGSTATNVTMTLRRGGDGTTSSVKIITIGAHQQISKFISDIFSDVPAVSNLFDGSLAIASDTPVAIVAIRVRGAIFSTIPITSLSGSTTVPQVAQGVGGATAVILPQFATGGGWSSQIVISNTTAIPVTVRVDLFNQDGTPLTTSLNGQSGSSFQNLVIPAQGILIENNSDNGLARAGYAIVTPLDNVPPTVTFTVPANGDSGVGISNRVTATFSEPMAASTISTTSFTLKQGSATITGIVSYNGITATFTPIYDLAPGTTYTGTITTGATDVAGNPLASNFKWTFTTAVAEDTTPPTVSYTVPASAATGVPINQEVSATFSKAMDPATITTATFTLNQGATPVAGTVSYIGVTATFSPSSNLAASTTYTATITTGAKDLAGNALASNYAWSFTTAAVPNTTAPTVTSTDPANNATGVALNRKIAATFSEAMDPLTITTVTFTLNQGVTPITGTVAYVGFTATFSPLSNLAASTTYTATITTGAKDLAGNALASSFVWSFTTGTALDTTPPTVISTDPGNGATGVALNKKVGATFSETMDPLTITTSTFTLQQGATNVPGTVTYLGTTATFSPASNLASSTTYTATVTTGAKDLAGNALASNFVWSFTTGAALDTTPPTVVSVSPLNGATGVALNKQPSATFSEAMDPLTMTTANFSVTGPGVTPVTGTVAYDAVNKIATFTPASNLASATTFTATITTGAKDLAGNALASNFVWTFSTAGSLGPATVQLGAATPYAILAGAGVTNSGPTIINGSLGTSPTGTLTGSPTVTGSTDLANPAAAAAKLALTAAYNDAAGRTLNAISLPGDLSGLTLAPGLYTNSSSVMLSAGKVYLDAQGDPNATWIFQMGSTLTTIAGTEIVLAGGAKAANVYWQVGSSATLGTNSIFKGNILAAISISANTGAVVEGRLLTQIGAVSLLSNVITVPNP